MPARSCSSYRASNELVSGQRLAGGKEGNSRTARSSRAIGARGHHAVALCLRRSTATCKRRYLCTRKKALEFSRRTPCYAPRRASGASCDPAIRAEGATQCQQGEGERRGCAAREEARESEPCPAACSASPLPRPSSLVLVLTHAEGASTGRMG